MNKNLKTQILRYSLIGGMMIILSLNFILAQYPAKAMFESRKEQDTCHVYSSSYFLHLKDNTILNFGITSNKKEGNYYVWYNTAKAAQTQSTTQTGITEVKTTDETITSLLSHKSVKQAGFGSFNTVNFSIEKASQTIAYSSKN